MAGTVWYSRTDYKVGSQDSGNYCDRKEIRHGWALLKNYIQCPDCLKLPQFLKTVPPAQGPGLTHELGGAR